MTRYWVSVSPNLWESREAWAPLADGAVFLLDETREPSSPHAAVDVAVEDPNAPADFAGRLVDVTITTKQKTGTRITERRIVQ